MSVALLLIAMLLLNLYSLGVDNLKIIFQVTLKVGLCSGFELPISMQLARLREYGLAVFFLVLYFNQKLFAHEMPT